MSKYNEKSKIYATKYNTKNYDRVLIRIRKDADITRQDIQQAADAAGESVNVYVLEAVRQRMEKES